MTQEIAKVGPTHRHYLDDNQDYVLFSIFCEACGFVFMEFVHYVPPRDWRTQDLPSLTYDPNRPSPHRGSQSCAKPNMNVLCLAGGLGHTVSASDHRGGPTGCAVKSRGLTAREYEEWRSAL